MNSLVGTLGLASWKAILTAIVLPPFLFLLLGLWGAWLLWTRRGVGWMLVLLAGICIYLSACDGVGQALELTLVKPPPPISATQIDALKDSPQNRKTTMIVVLGGGREAFAPEYGTDNLSNWSLARLRFGLWLGRETGLPVGFSGGTGWAQLDGPSEADVAARIAANEFGRPLRWIESRSRDTRENAEFSIAKLSPDVKNILLVTHGWHMPRALRAFTQACAARCQVTPAPMGLAPRTDRQALKWLPSAEGFEHVRQVLREGLGLLAGS